MSRIGRKPIAVPHGVEVHLNERHITVRGPKGTIARELPREVMVEVAEGTINVSRPSDDRIARSMHGLGRGIRPEEHEAALRRARELGLTLI